MTNTVSNSATGQSTLLRNTAVGGFLGKLFFNSPIIGAAIGALTSREGFVDGARRVLSDIVGGDPFSFLGPILGGTTQAKEPDPEPAKKKTESKGYRSLAARMAEAEDAEKQRAREQPSDEIGIGTIAKAVGLGALVVGGLNLVGGVVGGVARTLALMSCYNYPLFAYPF